MKPLTLDRLKSLVRTGSVQSARAVPVPMDEGWLLQVEHTDHLYGQILCKGDGEERAFLSADSLLKTAQSAGFTMPVAFHLQPHKK
ncbi:hypothetical protein [Chitinimonas koreensis]|uniref:hypothetical protein n=1 Tax=Chitinimonas koreensis TaxID=356302 RepID=UPI0012F89FDA|nr:hypothetical protein [Chitinimonas koreensis]QNM95484.1 hypothetical protein H9L41_16655 [Chitinimonas koreensis]